jgi:hypothetical protein
MSAWIVIGVADLNRYQVAALVEAASTAALADGQANPFDETMHDRCNYIRNRISKRIQISLTPYAVPPELVSCAALLTLEALQTRIPGLSLSEDHKTQIARAYKDLDIAGTEDFPVSTPDDPETPAVQSGAGKITIVRKPTRVMTRDSMNAL